MEVNGVVRLCKTARSLNIDETVFLSIPKNKSMDVIHNKRLLARKEKYQSLKKNERKPTNEGIELGSTRLGREC